MYDFEHMIYFTDFSGGNTPAPHYGRERPPLVPTPSTAVGRARATARPPQCLA